MPKSEENTPEDNPTTEVVRATSGKGEGYLVGWPAGLKPRQRQLLAAYARNGGMPYRAAKQLGYPISTVERWIRDGRRGVEPMASGLAMAEEIAVLALEDRLGAFRGDEGAVGLQATLRSLEAKDPVRWSSKYMGTLQVEHTHKRLVLDQPRTLEVEQEGGTE